MRVPVAAAGVNRHGPLPSRGVLALTALALVAVGTTDLVDFAVDRPRTVWLDAASSGSWSHRLVAFILIAAAAMSLVGAVRVPEHRAPWGVSALILCGLALDELTPLHAQVDNATWGKAAYAPVLVVLCLALWRATVGTGQRRLLRLAVAMLVLAFTVHVFGGHLMSLLHFGSGSWPYQVKVVVKEGTELAGWLLVLVALARAVGESAGR